MKKPKNKKIEAPVKHDAHVKYDSKNDVYEFKEWRKSGVLAAFSGKHYRMNFTDTALPSVVIASRRNFCEKVGVAFDQLVCLEQIHGANIIRVDPKEAGRGAKSKEDAIPGTDGVISNAKGVVLAVRSADCAPIFFFDPVRKAIGLAHIGWRSANAGLASKMVQALRVQFLSKPEDIIVAVGAMIRPCCYEVGEELEHEFKGFVKVVKPGKYHLDLSGFITNQIMGEGVPEKNIQDSHLCTCCNSDAFHSYRKEKQDVRHMLSVLALI